MTFSREDLHLLFLNAEGCTKPGLSPPEPSFRGPAYGKYFGFSSSSLLLATSLVFGAYLAALICMDMCTQAIPSFLYACNFTLWFQLTWSPRDVTVVRTMF